VPWIAISGGGPHQRCIFHKIKNLADHLVFNDLQLDQAETQEQAVREAKRARKQVVLAEVGWMYEGQSAAEIESRARLFAMIWRGREPEADQRERPLNSERLFRIDHENSRKSR